MTRLARVWLATKLTLDALGRVASLGYMVRKSPDAVELVAVRLRTTAVAVAGTPDGWPLLSSEPPTWSA